MIYRVNKWLGLTNLVISFLITGWSMSVAGEEVWIDVRTPEEFAAGHPEGALLIPHDQIASLISEQIPDKDADIQLYCRSGRRADVARDILLQMGYTRVTNHGSLENALLMAKKHPAGDN